MKLPLIPDFRLPPSLAMLGAALPQWPHGALLSLLLNAARRLGLLDAESLAALEGKRFRIRVDDLASVADFQYRAGKFRPLRGSVASPDLSFSANSSAYLQLLARQEDPDTLFFNRRLEINGDTELGLRVKNMLDALDAGELLRRRNPFAH